jgi:hypothetical protein
MRLKLYENDFYPARNPFNRFYDCYCSSKCKIQNSSCLPVTGHSKNIKNDDDDNENAQKMSEKVEIPYQNNEKHSDKKLIHPIFRRICKGRIPRMIPNFKFMNTQFCFCTSMKNAIRIGL